MVKKAVILAGGRGTRFLPYTKACPKEMLAVSDKPALHYVVEEAAAAGIEEIAIIINAEKQLIREYFTENKPLYDFLEKKGESARVEELRAIDNLARFTFIEQPEAGGTGEALLLAEKFAAGETIAVLNADDVMYTKQGYPNVMQQLVKCHIRFGGAVLAVSEAPPETVVKCGAISVAEREGRLIRVDDVVEKPALENAPSNIVTQGRYIIDAKTFEYLHNTQRGRTGELNFTDALKMQAQAEGIYGWLFDGVRYDMGDKLGCFKAVVEYTLRDEKLGDAAKEYLQTLFKQQF